MLPRPLPPPPGMCQVLGTVALAGILAASGLACSGGLGDTGATSGIVLVNEDDRLADLGLAVRTYAVTAAHPGAVRDAEGGDPLFYVVASQDRGADSGPGLLFLHGLVFGDESVDRCTAEGIHQVAYEDVLARRLAHVLLARSGRAMLVPVSTWCDLWSGLGPDDPVDASHASLVHVQTALAAMEAGLDGVRLDLDRTPVWGSSIGALGSFVVSAHLASQGRSPPALVADSGPFDLLTMASEATDQQAGWLEHILGGLPYDPAGQPTPYLDNWRRLDVPSLLDDGLRLPIFAAWNSQDDTVEGFHGPALLAALQDLDAGAPPWFARDFDHGYPLGGGHTQLNANQLLPAFAVDAAVRHLDGARVDQVEIETLCGPTGCSVLDAQSLPAGSSEELEDHLVRAVGGTAAWWSADQAPGSVVDVDLSALPVLGTQLHLAVALDAIGVAGHGSQVLVELELLDGEERLALAQVDQLALSSDGDLLEGTLRRLDSAALDLDAQVLQQATQPHLRVRTLEPVELLVDGLWLSWTG